MDWMYKNINPYYDKIRNEEVEIDEEIWVVGDTKSGKIAATAKTEKSAKAFVAARGERRRRGKKWLPPKKVWLLKRLKEFGKGRRVVI